MFELCYFLLQKSCRSKERFHFTFDLLFCESNDFSLELVCKGSHRRQALPNGRPEGAFLCAAGAAALEELSFSSFD